VNKHNETSVAEDEKIAKLVAPCRYQRGQGRGEWDREARAGDPLEVNTWVLCFKILKNKNKK
jgi:hypothetical protein